MITTPIKTVMTPNPYIIDAGSNLKTAAQHMDRIGCGVLPVGNGERLEGIITDRDIVIRAVARGKDVNTEKVADYMTTNLYYCNEDDTLEDAVTLMRDHLVNRLVVKDSMGRVAGIVTFGCILRKDADEQELNAIVALAVGRRAA